MWGIGKGSEIREYFYSKASLSSGGAVRKCCALAQAEDPSRFKGLEEGKGS